MNTRRAMKNFTYMYNIFIFIYGAPLLQGKPFL